MNVHVVEPERFGEIAAALFIESIAGLRGPVVGLATGNTPVPLYEALKPHASRLRAVHPFAIDEYGGPRDHPCANRAFFARSWNAIAGVRDVRQFDPWATDPERECERFARVLGEFGGLDLAVVGIGLNGHLAFNEPGTERTRGAHVAQLETSTRASAARCWGEATPTWGMTLGLADLLGAHRVLLIASGAAKAEIVAAALAGGVSASCPASFLQEHSACDVLLDTAAAAALPQEMLTPSRA